MDLKPPSSGEKSDESILEKLKKKDQVKIVLADEEDYEFAKNVAGKFKKCEIIFQPVDGVDAGWIVERAVKDKLKVRITPQLHKIWGLE